MPLAEHALSIYETVRDTLGLTAAQADSSAAQTRIEFLINAVSQAMIQEARREFHRVAGQTEAHAGFGDYVLITRRAPIVSITSITYLDIEGNVETTLDSTSYRVDDPEAGIIYRPSAFLWSAQPSALIGHPKMPGTERLKILVTYTAGWITSYQADNSTASPYAGGALGTRDLPYDLEEACIESVISIYRRGSSGFGISSQTESDRSINYTRDRGLLLPSTRQVARRYVREIM